MFKIKNDKFQQKKEGQKVPLDNNFNYLILVWVFMEWFTFTHIYFTN